MWSKVWLRKNVVTLETCLNQLRHMMHLFTICLLPLSINNILEAGEGIMIIIGARISIGIEREIKLLI